jgi:hypothetical protein
MENRNFSDQMLTGSTTALANTAKEVYERLTEEITVGN